MKNLRRASFRAAISEGVSDDALLDVFGECENILTVKKRLGEVYTTGLFRWRDCLFLYLELLFGPGPLPPLRPLADSWLTPLLPCLKPWPELVGDLKFAYMTPVFWFDEPKSADYYARALPPDARCGRIARLFDDRAMSYLSHHQAIVSEGLMVGDRYQFISVHENLLFSYYETPRDRERVNLRRQDAPSAEIEAWLAADPDSHFDRFPEAPDSNFMDIPAVFSL